MRTDIVRKILIIRADAAPHIGVGHVVRCLALARQARAGGMHVILASRSGVPWLTQRLSGEDVAHVNIPGDVPTHEDPLALLDQLAGCGRTPEESWCVLDGYHFTPGCQQAVRAAGYRLMVVDDYNHLPAYHADILLNQNLGADTLAYHGDVGRALPGPRYALLRPEFVARRTEAEQRRHPPRAREILLSLGGGDFSLHLARIAPLLEIREMDGATLRVIAGAMPVSLIRELLASTPARLEILPRVDDMPGLLLRSDFAVSAGGSTCWELCCLGLPFLTFEVAENQRDIIRELDSAGIAPKLCESTLRMMITQAEVRSVAACASMMLVDGKGCERVVAMMQES